MGYIQNFDKPTYLSKTIIGLVENFYGTFVSKKMLAAVELRVTFEGGSVHLFHVAVPRKC